MDGKIFFHRAKDFVDSIIKKRRLKKYYIQKDRQNKTLLAMTFDDIFVKLFFFMCCLGFFFYITEDVLFSLIISLQFLVLFVLITHKIKKINLSKAITKINKQVAKKNIYKNLTNITPYDFIESMKENLQKCNFENLVISSDREIDLVGHFGDNSIGIKCLQYNSDYEVNANIVREFFLALRKHDLRHGMIITTSDFSQDAKELLPKLKNHAEIRLINIDSILDIMKKAKTYPTDKELEKIILSHLEHRKGKINEYKDTVLSKGKSTKYLIIGVMILFFGRITPYQLYYEIVAIILISLGIFSIINYMISLYRSYFDKKQKNIV